jgi:hypothetical protein
VKSRANSQLPPPPLSVFPILQMLLCASWLLQTYPLLLKVNFNPKLIELTCDYKCYATSTPFLPIRFCVVKKKMNSINQFSNLC